MKPKKPSPDIDENIWSGIACLKANPKVKNFRRFGKGKGAYVNVVAWAQSQTGFEEKVKRHSEIWTASWLNLRMCNYSKPDWDRRTFPKN